MIKVDHLHKQFVSNGISINALNDVSLEIQEGEIFGIIGRSGAGKSTLIRTFNLLERPDTGSISINQLDLLSLDTTALQQARQKIGMVFQHFNLLSSRTVEGNIRFPLELAGQLTDAEINARVTELLALVGLSAHRNAYPAQLSGGQKQRVGIARALANQPELLLCDEATSALDPETTESILQLLQDINQKLNLTIVLITHEMRVIRQICDRVAVLDKGSVVETGKVIDVFLFPAHEVTKSLLAETGLHLDPTLLRKKHLHDGLLLKLTFTGDAALNPVLDKLSREHQIHYNLFQGAISEIKGESFGQLIAGIKADHLSSAEILAVFAAHGVKTEVIQ